MKRQYIEPKNTVVKCRMEQIICQSFLVSKKSAASNAGSINDVEMNGDGLARRTVTSQDAWEEW